MVGVVVGDLVVEVKVLFKVGVGQGCQGGRDLKVVIVTSMWGLKPPRWSKLATW